MARRLTGRGLARLLSATGLAAAWRFWHRHAVIILTVHGVADDTGPRTWTPLRSRLPARRLDECLAVLKQHYHFITLAEAVDMLSGRRPLRNRAMVLTFDDGYRNQLTAAAPVLEKHGVPATVFVATGFVEQRRPFWFDRIDFALQQSPGRVHAFTVGGTRVSIDGGSRSAMGEGYARLRAAAKAVHDDDVMTAALDEVAMKLEADAPVRLRDVLEQDEWSAVVTRDELRHASAQLSFGSHTVDHCRIAYLPPAATARQLTESMRSLHAWTGEPCALFCYPDGAWTPAAAAQVKAAGYAAAVTTDRGLNYRGDDLWRLKRFDVPAAGDSAELLADVSGLLDWLLALRDRFRGRQGGDGR